MTITYAKLRSGEWGVRGPSDQITEGAAISVTKRDGTVRTETVRKIYFNDGTTAIASVHDAARVRSGRQTRVRAQASRVTLTPRMQAIDAQSRQPGGVSLTDMIAAQRADRADAIAQRDWQAAQAELAAERAQAETRREAMDAGGDFRAQLRAMLGE